MSPIDIAILVAFLLYALSQGWRSKKEASKNLDEYFLAGRSLPGWKAGMSMAATQFAADTPLLVTGLIATAGIFSLWRMWIYAIAFLVMGFMLGPSWRKAGVLTDAELTEIRYGEKPAAILRGIKALYTGTVLNCVGLAIVLLAATRIAEPFLVWNEWLPAGAFQAAEAVVKAVGAPLTIDTGSGADIWLRSTNNLISIVVIALTTTLYSTTGGLRSVVNTDIMQFVIGIVGSALYAWFIIDASGGIHALHTAIAQSFPDGGPGGITSTQILAFTPSQAKDASLTVLAVIAIQWLAQMNADGSGYLAQRTMACRSDEDAKQAAVVFAVVQVLLRSLIWLPIGLGLMMLFPSDPGLPLDAVRAERETTFVRGVAELLPPGVKGLMLVGLIAALASTIDTHLNWGSSYWTNDIYKRFICRSWLKREPSGRALVWVARLSNLFILAIAMTVMVQLSSIQTAWKDSLLLGAGMGVVLLLRWLWWRINVWGEISCLITSLVLVPILITTVPAEEVRVIVLAVVSAVTGIVVSLATGPEDMERLKAFYDRSRPPGFWGPVAEACGLDIRTARRQLLRSGSAVALASMSLFCLLTGFGSLICNSPPPTWFPWRSLWIGMLIAGGTLLIPVWLKLGFKFQKNKTA